MGKKDHLVAQNVSADWEPDPDQRLVAITNVTLPTKVFIRSGGCVKYLGPWGDQWQVHADGHFITVSPHIIRANFRPVLEA